MKNSHDIHQIFTEWGKREQQLPAHNEELKNKALAALSAAGPAEGLAVQGRPRLPWFSFAFAALAGLVFILNTGAVRETVMPADAPVSYGTSVGGAVAPSTRVYEENAAYDMDTGTSIANQSMTEPAYRKMSPDYYPVPPYPGPIQGVPATDDREFLRTDYNASIRTRDVQDLTRRVETAVHAFDGRVDSSTNSEKWGSVSFVVPASRFDAFRGEIESLVGKRFIKTDIYRENMLPQKQAIEQSKEQNDKDLAKYKADRQKLVAGHKSTVSSLQTQLNSIDYELALLRSEQTSDPARQNHIAVRQQQLFGEQATLQGRLSNENASYSRQLGYLDSTILAIENNGQGIAKQDQNLLDTVATVRGTISLNWISIWEVVKLFVAPGWMVVILLAGALASYLIERRRRQLVLP